MDCHLFLLKCILKKGEQSWRLPSQKVKKDLINDKQKKQGTGTVIKQDILENRHNTIILALGSNLGNRADNIEKKIQWVAGESVKIKIIVPDQLFFGETFNEDSLREIEGHVEQAYLELKDGDEIQFIRFGYCRKESTHQVIFTHK